MKIERVVTCGRFAICGSVCLAASCAENIPDVGDRYERNQLFRTYFNAKTAACTSVSYLCNALVQHYCIVRAYSNAGTEAKTSVFADQISVKDVVLRPAVGIAHRWIPYGHRRRNLVAPDDRPLGYFFLEVLFAGKPRFFVAHFFY